MQFPDSVRRHARIETWMREHLGELGEIARRWFDVMRDCGDDVRELLHDGHPTACVGDAAFGYVNIFAADVNGSSAGPSSTTPPVCWKALASSCAT